MSPIQQMLLGVGAVATKTYVDDVFSTYVYEGDGNSSRNITNNIDLLTEGGLVWYKSRSAGKGHRLVDTERGVTKVIESNDNNAEAVEATGLKAFLTNGFTVGSDDTINESGGDQASWTFRKAPGFFDVVTWTGNSDTDQVVSHSLGSLPGMILYKPTSSAGAWWVYHREMTDTPNYAYAVLNTAAAAGTDSNQLHDVTSTTFKAVDLMGLNTNGETYVAYLFAGGESTAATARSVKFDGSDDYIRTPDHSDLDLDTNQFTIEMWVKSSTDPSSGNMNLVGQWGGNDRGYAVRYSLADQSFNGWGFQYCTNEQGSDVNTINGSTGIDDGQWHHLAVVRESSTIKLYTDGNLSSSTSISGSLHITNSERDFYVGSDDSDNRYTGNVSNVRVVVGTALYTSSFKPPTEPLTNVTNTKLLCCNNSSVTGSTVSPGTFYSGGGPTASSNSPFDDPAGFSFGDAGDQNVIKCGSYVGNGSSTGPEINLGWEPQWVMFKATDRAAEWSILDCMRGIVTGGDDAVLYPSESDAEVASSDIIEVSATGFRLKTSNQLWNQDTKNYIFTAIRRSDGYCGKPPELGTGVFAMDTGNGSSTIPTFDSTFPVDMSLVRNRYDGSTSNWELGSRSLGSKFMYPNLTNSEATSGKYHWDSNAGVHTSASGEYDSNSFAWMWKRHAGFDVVTYTGTGAARTISHSMNAVPQMMWIKDRTTTGGGGSPWYVYHSGTADSGMGYGYLNNTDAWSSSGLGGAWNSTAPTSTAFSLGTWAGVNYSGASFIAMLFASVDGISKVGSYDGSDSAQTISLGFQPRFVIIKATNSAQNWIVLDTVRGWGSGADQFLQLDHNDSQSGLNIGAPTSTGMSLDGNVARTNDAGTSYIYYAHA